MKQKKWVDCPSCGFKGGMHFKKYPSKIFESKKYPKVKIGPLSEYVCRNCNEGIYTIRTDNLIQVKLAEHKARCDADNTVVSEVLHVSDASKFLKMTRQGVIKLMKRGKLAYVFFGNSRLPMRRAVIDYSST